MLTVDCRRLGLRPGDRVLDVGAGAGRHAFEALRLGADVVAADMDGAALKEVAVMFEALELDGASLATASLATEADALHLPFPDGAFDRVIAAEILEHVPDDRAAMAELARVLRPGGVLAVTVPRWFPELVNWILSDEYHLVPGGHVRIYREGVLRERLAGAGLAVVDRHHAHGLHSPYWWLKCAVGVGDDEHRLVQAYHRLLVREMVERPLSLRLAERALQPVIGKSLVLYAMKAGRAVR
ncbi:MAG TPA: methyltransferase domain-containing protein [Acidimicrobiales bacterium]|nr:methyltransferase domain-containing protein [Acidimicrobiales bacterium]